MDDFASAIIENLFAVIMGIITLLSALVAAYKYSSRERQVGFKPVSDQDFKSFKRVFYDRMEKIDNRINDLERTNAVIYENRERRLIELEKDVHELMEYHRKNGGRK